MLLTSCDPKKNHILSKLSADEYEQLSPHLELVTLSRAEVLFDANEKLQSVYFPITATTSLCCFEDGSSVQ
ncbi:Crp/Fnr family transcriptional regulator, partial [Nitrosomonas supralitoralis]